VKHNKISNKMLSFLIVLFLLIVNVSIVSNAQEISITSHETNVTDGIFNASINLLGSLDLSYCYLKVGLYDQTGKFINGSVRVGSKITYNF